MNKTAVGIVVELVVIGEKHNFYVMDGSSHSGVRGENYEISTNDSGVLLVLCVPIARPISNDQSLINMSGVFQVLIDDIICLKEPCR